ncbi:hypothetical protein [Streptomyces sp. H27-S2]|uniref:hypothetical protein n=1 Tax=Streptomyces antarcticus TaxID=2996458 RepID=UPI00226D9671|nr:hypothetical protein [Streptomyces sp. H27-S2]MCY0954447.1 hypothetical protein [Streptomyces sp. H27-S2]
MTDSETKTTSGYHVTVHGERFTCREVSGLGPQGDGDLPGQVLTVTLTDCVLTDTPRAQEWALSADASPVVRHVKIEETAGDTAGEAAAPLATWYLSDARPGAIGDYSTTASNHETRIDRLTVHAEKIAPDLPV